MDDRQRKVEAGAGLQESRLNQDFIDLVKKHGTNVLLVLLVVMLAYVGWQKYTQWQEDRTDQAFADLDNAANTPTVLLSVASDWDGRGSVWEIATLRAARAYLDSARTRTEPGIDPASVAETELLSDERVVGILNEAITLFQAVLDRTRGDKLIFAQDARWGIATANLSLASLAGSAEERTRHLDAAQTIIQELVEVAEGTEPNRLAAGQRRLELIEILREQPIRIYETAQLTEGARFQPDPLERSFMDPMISQPAPVAPANADGSGPQPLTDEEMQEIIRRFQEGDNTIDPGPLPETDPGSDDPATDPGSSDDPASDDPASEDPPAGNPGQ